MESISRREFFSRKILRQIWQKEATTLPLQDEFQRITEPVAVSVDDEHRVMPEYFSSPLYSYALLSEMPWDMLLDEAKRLGIEYEGRSKMDIIREIFLGSSGKDVMG